VGPRNGVDICRKSRSTGIRSADSPACSEWDASMSCVLFMVGKRLTVTLFRLTFTAGSRSRYQWPCGIRRRSAAAQLLGSRVRIPLTA
jgi:hypothetical protein